MDVKEYAKFNNKEELAATLIAEAWADGIDMRTQDDYLDLKPIPAEVRADFIERLTRSLIDKICAFEYFNFKNKDLSLLQICHYNETTSDEILATAARESGIKLHYLPTYSYSKIFLTNDNKLMLDINTTDINKRDAYVIEEKYEDDKVNIEVKQYSPEAGIDLQDFLAREESKNQPQM